jgi:hypothetical protein
LRPVVGTFGPTTEEVPFVTMTTRRTFDRQAEETGPSMRRVGRDGRAGMARADVSPHARQAVSMALEHLAERAPSVVVRDGGGTPSPES